MVAEKNQATVHEQVNLLARLDRVPVNRRILFLVFLLGVVWILEAFDIGIIAPVLLIIRGLWHLQPSDVGLIGAAGTLGIVLGLLPAGRLADRYGRKTTLLAGIVVFSVFTFVTAFAQSTFFIVACRFIAGLGQGAVFPVPYLLLSEFVNKQWRGRAVGYANSVLGFSYGLNTLAGALITGHMAPDSAWRALLMIGGVPLLLVPLIVVYLPESPRFLLKVGKVAAVRRLVGQLEDISGVAHDETIVDPEAMKVLEYSTTRKVSVLDLFRPPYLRRCFIAFSALLSPFVVFYIITIYGPSIIQRMGASQRSALYYTSGLLFLTVFSTAIAGVMGDRISRRWGLVAIMSITTLATIALGLPLPTAGVIAAAIVVWPCVYAGFPLAKLYMAEQFPTRLRASGSMLGESITRFLGGVVLVYLFPILDARLGSSRLFLMLAVLTQLCVLPIWLLGFQTSGISIEQAGTDVRLERLKKPAKVG